MCCVDRLRSQTNCANASCRLSAFAGAANRTIPTVVAAIPAKIYEGLIFMFVLVQLIKLNFTEPTSNFLWIS